VRKTPISVGLVKCIAPFLELRLKGDQAAAPACKGHDIHSPPLVAKLARYLNPSPWTPGTLKVLNEFLHQSLLCPVMVFDQLNAP